MSNFSYTGSQPRCTAYWQKFSLCFSNADVPSQCRAQGEDYMECLHGRKAAAREEKITHEAAKMSKQLIQQRLQEQSGNVGVGLIEGKPE